MSGIDIYADNFGVAPGLTIKLTHTESGLQLQASLNGEVFESYALRDVDTAVEAVGYLIRGSQPPRALFLCRDTPSR